MVRRLYISALIILLAGIARGQQQPIYSQYMMNPYLLNPAIAGYQGITDFNLTAREQWLGYSEGPSTYALSAQTRILRTSFRNRSRMIKQRVRRRRPSGRVGLGGYIFNDMNGDIRRTGFQGSYAYHIFMRDLQISAGVSLAAFQFKANVSPSDLYDPYLFDPLVQGGKTNSAFAPDANIGFLVSSEDFYAGFSATSLFESAIQFGRGNPSDGFRLKRQYYMLGGYKYQERRSDYGFVPSLMLTFTEQLAFSADINFKAYYKHDYWAGVSYRTTKSVVLMFGMNYQQFYFGYAFDYGFGDISGFNTIGTHEFMVGMRLGDTARRYRWLNRF